MPWIEQQLLADGVSAEGRVVVNKALLEIAVNDHVLSLDAVGNNNGSGYVVGETFDIVGGTAISINGVSMVARGRVTSISGDDVTGVEILSAGVYSVLPGTSDIATANSSAGGDNLLTVDLTTEAATWTQDESDYTDLLTLFEWLATSTKATNKPTIGGQSQLSGSDDGVRLQIASGYDNGSTWLTQPGAPPTNEFFCTCPNQDPILYVSVTDRRLNFMVTDGTNKQYGGTGLFIPRTDVEGNYPFPGICHGNQRSITPFNSNYERSDFAGGHAGICNPMDLQSGNIGPYQYRHNLSTEWFGISDDNNGGLDTARSQMWPSQGDDARYQFNHAPVPAGSSASAADMNPLNSTDPVGSFSEEEWFQTDDQSDESGSQGPAPLGEQNQLHFRCLPHIISNQPGESQIIGYLDGWQNIHGRGLTAFDEIADEAGNRFLVFNDTNTTDVYRWVAMEKL